MKIFGREPALILALIASAIKMFAAFVIDLSTDQQAVLNAVASAIVGFIIAYTVRDGLVAAILGVAQALFALAIGFGFHVDPDNQAVVMSFLGLATAAFIRTQVTAPVPAPAGSVTTTRLP